MTLPRPYGGGYSSPSFPDTPIYDRLVAERGTPQIAPIRVPAAYDSLGYQHPSPQPSLPALPALPSASSAPPQPGQGQHGGGGYPGYQATPVRQPFSAPSPSYQSPGGYGHQQQPGGGRPYPAAQAPQAPSPQQMRPAAPQQMRPAAPRPQAPRPGGYPTGGGYPQHQQAPAPAPGYWSEQGA
ncbi:DUF6643 family protein [Streptomyces profundus]|uniref:DUF6643 family protein n=1 Tax=Streptomyces profundus TaxID=2867410 RepID=UPI001D16475F|nr:DUF6643 family protein [Streptomyces sp. MA3_2.13]UED82909.1 hypothetical protein K4G22_00820 [Streptomyces sp. MA3_2.13]